MVLQPNFYAKFLKKKIIFDKFSVSYRELENVLEDSAKP